MYAALIQQSPISSIRPPQLTSGCETMRYNLVMDWTRPQLRSERSVASIVFWPQSPLHYRLSPISTSPHLFLEWRTCRQTLAMAITYPLEWAAYCREEGLGRLDSSSGDVMLHCIQPTGCIKPHGWYTIWLGICVQNSRTYAMLVSWLFRACNLESWTYFWVCPSSRY